MDTLSLRRAHADLWSGAVRHPFLDGVRTGELPEPALAVWLAQDFQFVERLLRVQSLVLAQAPRADQLVLAHGVAALAEELDWFTTLAQPRALVLEVELHPSCHAYTEYLLALAWNGLAGEQPYASCITAIWAIEQTYHDAWLGARPGAPPFRPLVDHWTLPAFADYVSDLAAAADRALAVASSPVCDAAATVFQQVVRYERDFWQIAFATSG